MLSKLLKHELKATARLLIPLYIILAALTIINRITFHLKISNVIYDVIINIFTFIFIISIILLVTATAFLMISRFYKNLLTDEGYLMFTLPVKTHQLINAKLLITLFWTIISFIAVLGSLFLVFATPDNMDVIMNVVREGIAEFEAVFGAKGMWIIIQLLFYIPGTLILNILMIYASIALGQLFKGHKLVGAIIAYIGIYTGFQIIMLIFIGIVALLNIDDFNNINTIANYLFPGIWVLLILTCVGFYGTTNNIFKKKLNLD